MDGAYESLLEQDESQIQLVKGYSRDHRPELNQAVLNLITSNQSNIPLFMQASGNSSDKTAFAEIVSQHTKSFQEAVENRLIVGGSALLTPPAPFLSVEFHPGLKKLVDLSHLVTAKT